MYKFVLLFTCLLSLTSAHIPDKLKEAFQKARAECAKEVKGVDISALDPSKFDAKIFENHDFKCLQKCVFVQLGLATDDGNVQTEKIVEAFELPKEATQVIKSCVEKTNDTDPCDRVMQSYRCIMQSFRALRGSTTAKP